MTLTETTEHRMRWFARFPGTDEDWTPRHSKMRGSWPWDVRCSCGLETRTGGAVRSYIEHMIWLHREFNETTGWHPVAEHDALYAPPAPAAPQGCQVQGRHCEECGAPVEYADDGYSPCCGEHIAYGPGCDGLHAEARR